MVDRQPRASSGPGATRGASDRHPQAGVPAAPKGPAGTAGQRAAASEDGTAPDSARRAGRAGRVGRADGARPRGGNVGTRRNVVTGGNVRRMLWILAIPVLTEQLLNALVGTFDTFLAGRISAGATSAIGLAAYVAWLASMLFAMVGTGTTALVARFVGAGAVRRANNIANQSIVLAAFNGVTTGVLLYALAPTLAHLQAMTGPTKDIAVGYLRFAAVGLGMQSLTLVAGAALRGAGDMRTPMVIQTLINIINVIASPCLVYGVGPFPRMGVTGIVTGTVLAQALGAVLMLRVLVRGRAGLVLRARALRPSWTRTLRVLRIGMPAGADGAIMWMGHFVFLMVLARLAAGEIGEAFYAAHIVAIRIEAFAYLPAVAWGTAAATMIGQALGARDADRARRTGHEAVLQCTLLTGAVAVLFYYGAEGIFAVMHKDVLVREAGVAPFKVLALFQPLLGVSIVYVYAMRGAGDTRFPMLITIIGVILVRLPIGAYFGIVLSGGLMGAWMGMCADMTWRATAAWLRYQRGKWLLARV